MRKHIKGYLVGFLSATIFFASFNVYGAGVTQTITAVLNGVNILVAGTKAASKGDTYTLTNGEKVPYSILYKNTTYLPMRKVAELVGKEVDWDGITSTANIVDKGTATITTNSRSNPAVIGQKIVCDRDDFSNGKHKIEITLTEVIKGQAAWDIIIKENKFNRAPKDGCEYMLVRFKVKALETEKDTAVDINNYLFSAVRKDGTVYNEFISLVIPLNLSTELYKGSEYEGFTYFQTTIGDEPLIRFSKTYDTYAWFNPKK
ncbi:MAG: hypothetical protein CVU84_04995 [Firmicutes bacterium HGW-Firmicutes-1]|nr:MAG: hypothetical protein CVU84_04995 [Firmicutes bacterium HGW-Firmicutes-1]